MAKLTFEEYVEDFLDAQIGLMSSEEIAQAKKGYEAFYTPKPKQEKHPLANEKVSELTERLARLVRSQKIAIEKAKEQGLAHTLATAFVKHAEEALQKRTLKKDLIALVDLSSDASRELNNQKVAAAEAGINLK